MKAIIACEFSGKVRDAFIARGHDAVSCDLIDTETPGPHITGDIRGVDLRAFDAMIAFPPCTYLTVAGARWWSGKRAEQEAAIEFINWLWTAPVPRISIENPIGILSTRFRKPDQIIQPWQFGLGETKATCLWLKNLRPLLSRELSNGRHARVHREPPSPDRWKNRSRTPPGIAQAMAEQWGDGDLTHTTPDQQIGMLLEAFE